MATKKYTVEVAHPQLEIDEQLQLHETGWRVQRAGWVLILLVPVLGALGLFGEGVLSWQQVEAGPYTAGFERFHRYEKEMQIKAEAESGHIAQIALPQQYMQHLRIDHILPEPESRQVLNSQVVYYFEGNSNRIVTIYAKAEKTGLMRGHLSINGQPFSIHHFIYP